MNDQEIESLLRQARPEGPPSGWKSDILRTVEAERTRNVVEPWAPAWGLLAACWVVILVLRVDTPAAEQGKHVMAEIFIKNRVELLVSLETGTLPTAPLPKPGHLPHGERQLRTPPPQTSLKSARPSLT